MNKHHIIYRTTNTLNNRYYIGMHSTENIDDGYLGSGRRIKAEIKKYGKENFVREVLEELPSKEALAQREAELVTEELRQDPLCLNLKNGGEGGQDRKIAVKNWKNLDYIKVQCAGLKSKWNDPDYRVACSAGSSKTMLDKHIAGKIKYDTFAGRTHTAETIEKMKSKKIAHGTGSANSQFGSCWVTNGVPMKIKKQDLEVYLSNGYIQGRKWL